MKLKNEVLKDSRGNLIETIKLFEAIEAALLASNEQTNPDIKELNYKLHKKFIKYDEVDVTIEELATIKQAIKIFLKTNIMGACLDIIEK